MTSGAPFVTLAEHKPTSPTNTTHGNIMLLSPIPGKRVSVRSRPIVVYKSDVRGAAPHPRLEGIRRFRSKAACFELRLVWRTQLPAEGPKSESQWHSDIQHLQRPTLRTPIPRAQRRQLWISQNAAPAQQNQPKHLDMPRFRSISRI